MTTGTRPPFTFLIALLFCLPLLTAQAAVPGHNAIVPDAPAEKAPIWLAQNGIDGAALSCYEEARDNLMLSENDAMSLCQGAGSVAPARCIERAEEETFLSERLGVELCRCATSTQPVDCYNRGQQDTFLEDNEIVDLCSPVEQLVLDANCMPLRRYPRSVNTPN